jgi:hypothetical protein
VAGNICCADTFTPGEQQLQIAKQALPVLLFQSSCWGAHHWPLRCLTFCVACLYL